MEGQREGQAAGRTDASRTDAGTANLQERGFVDIHSHILPGLDDGAADWDETGRMLRQARSDNVAHILCTPHAYPGEKPFPLDEYTDKLYKANRLSKQLRLGVTLHPGAEVLYREGVTEQLLLDGKIPTLADSRHVLVEFGSDATCKELSDAIDRMLRAGFITVIAHVERYRLPLRKLVNLDAKMQVNGGTILKPDCYERRLIRKLAQYGMLDYVASDAHHADTRKTNLLEACAALVSRTRDGELAQQAFQSNAQEIIS